LNGH